MDRSFQRARDAGGARGASPLTFPGLRLVRSLLLVEKVSRELAGHSQPKFSQPPIGFGLRFLNGIFEDALLGVSGYVPLQVMLALFPNLSKSASLKKPRLTLSLSSSLIICGAGSFANA
jgi:hypothetical protein